MSKNKKLLGGLASAVLAIAGGGYAVTQYSTSNDANPSHSHSTPTRAADQHAGVPQCRYGQLPREAQQQIDDILQDAPPDDGYHDGKHFGNYERLLPQRRGNYYREYTVTTPGIKHRGARRIVVGGGTKTDPEVWYYTSDHFESFCAIPDAEKHR